MVCPARLIVVCHKDVYHIPGTQGDCRREWFRAKEKNAE
jgi:hypothetical protein